MQRLQKSQKNAELYPDKRKTAGGFQKCRQIRHKLWRIQGKRKNLGAKI